MNRYLVRQGQKVDLGDVDPDDTSLVPGGKAEAKIQLAAVVERLAELQELIFAGHERKVLIVLQGMDTAGKDGTIRHVMRGFNPQGTRVVSFRKPSEEELEHDFLWRVHVRVPAKGETVVFNRSHYEDVLIVRVHDLVPRTVWRKRYDQINAFERMLYENGTVILKFFLHISAEEQRKRLQARVEDPKKCWKFQHGDLEERRFWKDYMQGLRGCALEDLDRLGAVVHRARQPEVVPEPSWSAPSWRRRWTSYSSNTRSAISRTSS